MVIAEWCRRLAFLLNRRRREESLREEMLAHREMMQDPRRFGNTLRLREESRDVWGWGWLDDIGRDVRYGWTMLRRSPGFAAMAVLTLALATGATTAVFSVVNGVLLQPLPFGSPDRLVQIFGRDWREDRGGAPDPVRGPVGPQELEAYQRESTTVAAVAAYSLTTAHVTSASGSERLTAVKADRELFNLLAVDALAGRTFRPDDALDVAVISAGLWDRNYQRDPSLPGRVVTIDGRPFTIIGVMPEAFQFPYGAGSMMPGALPESRTDVWLPLEPLRASSAAPLRRGRMSVVARLAAGVPMGAAAAELAVIASRVEQQFAGTPTRIAVRVEPLEEVVIGPVRRSLWLLFAAVALVLAAACANLANLLLARMTVRVREVMTRAALGASRRRLFRQFLAESLLLAMLGGLAGGLIARWGTRLLTTVASTRIPRVHEVSLDWQAFLFLLLVCASAALLFGLAPALAAARTDVQGSLKDAVGAATMAGRFRRVRDALVVAEVALAFLLAVAAAGIIREMVRLERADAGMDSRQVLTLHLTPRAPAADYAQIEQRVAALPGIEGAGLTQLVPLQNWGWEADFTIKGRPVTERRIAGLRYVTPGYFRTLRIPVLRGRAFSASDDDGAPPVVIVNDALARRHFGRDNPVGQELDRGTIIGVIGDVRQAGLGLPVEPEIYYPAAQNVTMAADIGMSLLVRTAGDPARSVDAIKAAIAAVNPALAIFNIRTMVQVIKDSLWELTLYRWLIGAFAALTLVLAAIGLHGVLAYHATARLREFAVRLALGSNPADLARLVVGQALRLSAAGLVGGAATGIVLETWARALPAGVTAGPAVYASAAAALLLITVTATLAPVLRVMRVNPAAALRHD